MVGDLVELRFEAANLVSRCCPAFIVGTTTSIVSRHQAMRAGWVSARTIRGRLRQHIRLVRQFTTYVNGANAVFPLTGFQSDSFLLNDIIISATGTAQFDLWIPTTLSSIHPWFEVDFRLPSTKTFSSPFDQRVPMGPCDSESMSPTRHLL